MIGRRLRDLRTARGMSLRALAAQSGVSATLLSQIERDVTDPSLRTLRQLAAVFGQSIATLFADDDTPAVHVSRPGQRSRIVSPAGFISYERLAPGNGQLEMLRGVLGPGEVSSAEPWSHDAVECTYVVAGTLTVSVGDTDYPVAAGETITLGPGQPHRYGNDTTDTVEFVLAVTPPVP